MGKAKRLNNHYKFLTFKSSAFLTYDQKELDGMIPSSSFVWSLVLPGGLSLLGVKCIDFVK